MLSSAKGWHGMRAVTVAAGEESCAVSAYRRFYGVAIMPMNHG